MDSAVFGETQILHQLRETVAERQGDRALDPILDRLFQAAVMTMAILPPPFVVPLYMAKASKQDVTWPGKPSRWWSPTRAQMNGLPGATLTP